MATNKVTTNVIDMSGNTGGLVWSQGTTAQRPAGVAGDLRLNTTDSRLEIQRQRRLEKIIRKRSYNSSFYCRFFSSRWWRWRWSRF